MSSVHLSRKLILESPERVPDGLGGFSESWVVLGEIWADVRLRTGRDKDHRAGRVSETDYRIIIRAAPQGAPSRPVPGQRLVEGFRRFVIEAVGDDDPQARYLTCFAREELVT